MGPGGILNLKYVPLECGEVINIGEVINSGEVRHEFSSGFDLSGDVWRWASVDPSAPASVCLTTVSAQSGEVIKIGEVVVIGEARHEFSSDFDLAGDV